MTKNTKTKSEHYRSKSSDKAEQILRGALPEFLKHGYARTTMDKIACSAGVSKQTLYSHFCDKDGLFTALVKWIAIDKFQRVWSQPLQGEPEQVLRDLARRLLSEVQQEYHLGFMRLIIAESRERPDLAALLCTNLPKPAIAILTEYLEASPELNLRDPEATASIFIGSLISFILTQEILNGKKVMPMEGDRLVDSLVELLLTQKKV